MVPVLTVGRGAAGADEGRERSDGRVLREDLGDRALALDHGGEGDVLRRPR